MLPVDQSTVGAAVAAVFAVSFAVQAVRAWTSRRRFLRRAPRAAAWAAASLAAAAGAVILAPRWVVVAVITVVVVVGGVRWWNGRTVAGGHFYKPGRYDQQPGGQWLYVGVELDGNRAVDPWQATHDWRHVRYVKVGIGVDPHDRRRAFDTGNGDPVVVWFALQPADAAALERQVHTMLDRWRVEQAHGNDSEEWFYPRHPRVAAVIRQLHAAAENAETSGAGVIWEPGGVPDLQPSAA